MGSEVWQPFVQKLKEQSEFAADEFSRTVNV